MSTDALLHVTGITKRFPGVVALDDVDLMLAAGEVLAVIGENGAGKSTLMKILAGVQRSDAGTVILQGSVTLEGSNVSFASVQDAVYRGVVLIHQELNLSDNLDVGANLFLGREPHRWGWIDRRTIAHRSVELLRRVGLDVAPDTRVADLPIGKQQLVEIARALSVDARVLIMDEPTSSLSLRETEQLFTVIRELRDDGVGIIYISHRLGEVRTIADRVTVLRDGRNVGELAREEIEHDRMVSLMVGRDLVPPTRGGASTESREPLLEVRGLRSASFPTRSIDLSIAPGEIVGLAGLVGAGRTESLEALFGLGRLDVGSIELEGKPVRIDDPRSAIAHGLALVPEDRQRHGVIVDWPIRENLSLPQLWRSAHARVWIDGADEAATAQRTMEELSVRAVDDRQSVHSLSGGNQQKIAFGKWWGKDAGSSPRVLLLDEPTRGVDVGAKEEIYRLITQLAATGAGVLFASSEMEEVLRLADRVLVFREGAIEGQLIADAITEENIMQLATGRGDHRSEGAA